MKKVILILLLVVGSGFAANKRLPNILLITTDQQFADVMSCAGSEWVKTPAMDSLAERGVRFTNAYVNYPVCMPERYTMYTGRLPCQRHLADKDNKPTISLGNQARAAGYDTAYFGKWHIQDATFSETDSEFNGFDSYSGGKDKSMTKNAIQYFSTHRNKPFFAVVSYYNPHDICEWGRKKAGRTDGIDMKNGEVDADPPLSQCPPLPDNFEISGDESEAVVIRRTLDKDDVPNAQKMAMGFTADEWRQYRWAYNRLVEMVDGQLGDLLQALEDNRLDEDTVVIFTSDHGDGYGAHRWHQKSVLYEESCRVPFIICYPGKGRKNETDDRLISVGIDLMATVSDLVGAELPKGPYYGLSALPFVLNENSKAPTHEYVVSETEVRVTSRNTIEGRGLRTPKYKYHVWNQGDHREQLFDMINDPGETRNLAANPEYAAQLELHRKLFADWLSKTDDTYSEN
jgi:choline-sulfatase